ncbi:MAG: DUF1566 domain-containing protein [Methylococcales bacterium]
MLDPHPRAQLCFVIQQYGQVIITEPKRCKGMLSDLAPHHRLEINLLIAALEQKVAQELLKPTALIPVAMQLDRLAQRLHDTVGIKEEFAYWAVESWALALCVIQQPMSKQTVQSIAKPQVMPAPKVAVTPPPKIIPPSATKQRIGKFIVQNGIAKDTETGLVWCRFAHGQTWKNGTAVGDAERVEWKMAFDVAKQFNQQRGYAGYTDWRLPAINEFNVLIDKTKGKRGNYIDTEIFPNNNTQFWSSSPNGDYAALCVNFCDGYSYSNYKDVYYAVRFVRG